MRVQRRDEVGCAVEAFNDMAAQLEQNRDRILQALEASRWNVLGAARALGIERANLHKRIRALGIIRDR